MRMRAGSLMIEVAITVAISIAILAGTFATLACVQRRCEDSQEKLVANSIAWDALWRAFNAKAGVSADCANAGGSAASGGATTGTGGKGAGGAEDFIPSAVIQSN